LNRICYKAVNWQRRKNQSRTLDLWSLSNVRMLYSNAADLVMAIHFAFVVFVPFGALLALKWDWIPWIHLPAAAWGLFVSLTGGACPLTQAENALRASAGEDGYTGGFIHHYLFGLLSPPGLGHRERYVLLVAVTLVNTLAYGWLHLRWFRSRRLRRVLSLRSRPGYRTRQP
jgi:hypothetical protein